MRFLPLLFFVCITTSAFAFDDNLMPIIEFKLDTEEVDGCRIGNEVEYHYTLTNVSSTTVTNIEISHPEIASAPFPFVVSSLAPGQTEVMVSPGRRALVESDYFSSSSSIFTQATATFIQNGQTHSELSDGIPFGGTTHVDDEMDVFFLCGGDVYGIVYIDENDNGNYDSGIDTPVEDALFTITGAQGVFLQTRSNSAGWYDLPVRTTRGNYQATFDRSTLPNSNVGYQVVQGSTSRQGTCCLATYLRNDLGFKESPTSVIEVSNFVDENNNGIKHAGEPVLPDVSYSHITNNDLLSEVVKGTTVHGDNIYFEDTDPGNNLNDVNIILPSKYANHFTVQNTYDDQTIPVNTTDNISFILTENNPADRDAAVNNIHSGSVRIGDKQYLIVYVDNVLNGQATGTLEIQYDNSFGFNQAFDGWYNEVTNSPDLRSNNGVLEYDYSIDPFGEMRFAFVLDVPANVSPGASFPVTATILPTSTDALAGNNSLTSSSVAVTSNVTNSMVTVHEEEIDVDQFGADEVLEYHVSFGNDSQAVVSEATVILSISEGLDPDTFQLENASHPVSLVKNGMQVMLQFDGLDLQALNSLGIEEAHFSYSIQPERPLLAGYIVEQEAFVSLDGAAFMSTNRVATEFVQTAGINDVQSQIGVYPNPVRDYLNFAELELGEAYLYTLQGRLALTEEINEHKLDLTSLSRGLYILQIVSDGQHYTLKVIKE